MLHFKLNIALEDSLHRYGRNLIKKIKEQLKKQQHQVVTFEEFCQYMGLQQDTVARQLR